MTGDARRLGQRAGLNHLVRRNDPTHTVPVGSMPPPSHIPGRRRQPLNEEHLVWLVDWVHRALGLGRP